MMHVNPQTLSRADGDEQTEVASAPDVPDAFAVDDASSANWLVRKVVESRNYAEHVKEWAALELRRAEREERFFLERFGHHNVRTEVGFEKAKRDELLIHRKSVAVSTLFLLHPAFLAFAGVVRRVRHRCAEPPDRGENRRVLKEHRRPFGGTSNLPWPACRLVPYQSDRGASRCLARRSRTHHEGRERRELSKFITGQSLCPLLQPAPGDGIRGAAGPHAKLKEHALRDVSAIVRDGRAAHDVPAISQPGECVVDR